MPELDLSFYLYILLLASFNLIYSLCSLYLKEVVFVSETLVSTLAGIILGPRLLGLIVFDAEKNLDRLYHFARLVIAVQVMASGIQLPSAYLRRHWGSLALLLGPVMMGSWMISSFLAYLLFWDTLSWVRLK